MRRDRNGVEVFANSRFDLLEIGAKPRILKANTLRGHRSGFGLLNQGVKSVELIDQPDEVRALSLRLRDGDFGGAVIQPIANAERQETLREALECGSTKRSLSSEGAILRL